MKPCGTIKWLAGCVGAFEHILMTNLAEFSPVLPGGCSKTRLRHEAVSHSSEIALLPLCPSAGSTFIVGWWHICFVMPACLMKQSHALMEHYSRVQTLPWLMLRLLSAPSGEAGTSPLCPYFPSAAAAANSSHARAFSCLNDCTNSIRTRACCQFVTSHTWKLLLNGKDSLPSTW